MVKWNGGFKSATCDPNWFGYFKEGGTAGKAAVNAALGLMEPTGVELVETSLRLYGMLKKKLYGLNASGRSPKTLTMSYFRKIILQKFQQLDLFLLYPVVLMAGLSCTVNSGN
jgi:hypothetical protein